MIINSTEKEFLDGDEIICISSNNYEVKHLMKESKIKKNRKKEKEHENDNH